MPDLFKLKEHAWSEGKGRYDFLDLFRGIIVLFMIEGHVVRELLTPELRAAKLFAFHEVFHGITAPGFLFSAGFAFAIAAQRRWAEAITININLFKRTWRAVMLILIGYALHLPYLSLGKTIREATPEQWNVFFAFDVLQCIGVGILLLRILLYVVKREHVFIASLCALTLAVAYAAPVFGTGSFVHLPLFFSSALTTSSGSPFPLFPFLGFLFAGAFVSWIFLSSAQKGREAFFMRWIFGGGMFLFVLGYCLDSFPLRTYPVYNFWSTSPNYFLMRLGILLLMLSTLWFFEDILASNGSPSKWIPRWLTMLGMQSLFVYIVHLLVLYGWVVNPEWNIRHWFGSSSGIFVSLLISFLVVCSMIPAAFAWRFLKKYHPVLTNGILWWMGFSLAWSFFFHPY